jgi:semaphorin 5
VAFRGVTSVTMLTRVLFGLAALLAAAAAFTAEVEDFRRVSGADLIVDEFSDAGAGADFTEILFDLARYQMVVGARDSLYRLGLEGLTKLERATWEVDENNRNLCMSKGQSKNDCRNFIKVLVMRGDRVFACGTHAFSPKCSWRKAEQINSVVMNIDGRGKCPHSPHDNSTARMTDDGDYYIGSAIDFSSNDHAIYRMAGSKFERMLRTEQYNALWLTKPDFVASFETDRFVYFLFREAAVEAVNCGKAVYSRIARICKNDNGGKLFLKDNWTTFLKARLNCSYPGDYPFYFDEIQSAYYLEETSTVYATFTSGENDIPGSAVCSFGLDAIEEAFASPFKTRERSDATWEPKDDDHAHFECGDSDGDSKDRSHLAVSSRQYQLVNSAVQPTTGEKGPILSVSSF